MIIAKNDVGRQVLMTNGDICTIKAVTDATLYPILLDNSIPYTSKGKYSCFEDDYNKYYREADIQGFITDVEETYDKDDKIKELNDYSESNDKDIVFTIPNNCVNMTLEIGEYEIKVQRRVK